MYLEISNIAAALGKNPYESREKMLLISWARHCPTTVRNYLIQNKCIIKLKDDEDTFTELQKETFSEILPEQFDVKDFAKIEKDIISEYKKKRNNEETETEIKQLKEYTQDLLKKNNGNLQEKNIIEKEKYTEGNDRMYYYNITDEACIGGKNDASIGEILLEIKTRTRKQNVRRNEYDLYQLIGYLLATKKNKGKIVQMYNKEKFDSDESNEQEYGLIDITDEPWNELSKEIIKGLKIYFEDLTELIQTSNYFYLTNVIPNKVRPIAKYIEINEEKQTKQEEEKQEEEKQEKEEHSSKRIKFCDENVKFKNLFRHISKNKEN